MADERSVRYRPSYSKSPLVVPEDNLREVDLFDTLDLDDAGRYHDEPASYDGDLNDSDDDEDGDVVGAGESVHVEGVPRSSQRFDAK
jgi:hypothetical protein